LFFALQKIAEAKNECAKLELHFAFGKCAVRWHCSSFVGFPLFSCANKCAAIAMALRPRRAKKEENETLKTCAEKKELSVKSVKHVT